jgi:hypothetical protein
MDFILQDWFIEAVVCISIGFIIATGIGWLFNECDKEKSGHN